MYLEVSVPDCDETNHMLHFSGLLLKGQAFSILMVWGWDTLSLPVFYLISHNF